MTQQRLLHFSPEAKRDLRGHIAYLGREASPRIAQRFVEKVQHSALLLLNMPGMGSPVLPPLRKHQEVLSFIVSAPFGRWILFYTVSSTEVRIERVIHGYQDLTRLLI